MTREKTPSREKLIELRFEKGMTREDIAAHFEVSIATVRRWIKDMNVPRTNKSAKPKRPKNITASGEIIAEIDDGRTSLDRALTALETRVVEFRGKGYYLDGRPASIDDILAAARTVV